MTAYQQTYWLQSDCWLTGGKPAFLLQCDPSFFDPVWTGEHMTTGKNNQSLHPKGEEKVLNPLLLGISALILSSTGCTEAPRVSLFFSKVQHDIPKIYRFPEWHLENFQCRYFEFTQIFFLNRFFLRISEDILSIHQSRKTDIRRV